MWTSPKKPSEITEKRLIEAILQGKFPVNTYLPGERDLAQQLGVTRPTLREALQRLAAEGWVEINQGKPTRIKNYLEEGNLSVLATMAKHQGQFPENLIPNLLVVRETIAPTYTKLAVTNAANNIHAFLEHIDDLADSADTFTQMDWQLHLHLCKESKNPIFTMIMNGFENLYQSMGIRYFEHPETRQASRQFYFDLHNCAKSNKPERAEKITLQAMRRSIQLWNAFFGGGTGEN